MSLTPSLVRHFLGPCPYDDSFIYWTVSFLALASPDRYFLGLSLDVFDTFVGPLVCFSPCVVDLVVLVVNLVDRRKNTLQQFLNKTPLIAMHLNKSN